MEKSETYRKLLESQDLGKEGIEKHLKNLHKGKISKYKDYLSKYLGKIVLQSDNEEDIVEMLDYAINEFKRAKESLK